jgi:GNAT superfamily N-acetyltransferase
MFSNSKVEIEYRQLEATQLNLIQQAAEWYIDKWGYTQNNATGQTHIVDVLQKNSYAFYMVYLKGNLNAPIGMFSLGPRWEENETNFTHFQGFNLLDDVYVHKEFRSLGIASKIVDAAKAISRAAGKTDIILQTFSPSLNGFYKRKGAKVLDDVETSCQDYPTDTLVIKL